MHYCCIYQEGLWHDLHVLLKGSVQVTSSSGLNLTLPEGVSFGEGALVTSVRREATVVALEPCHLAQLTAETLVGLENVELDALRCHVIGMMLAKVSASVQPSTAEQPPLQPPPHPQPLTRPSPSLQIKFFSQRDVYR